MNTLYFCKARDKAWNDIVSLQTAKTEDAAKAKAMAFIADEYRANFEIVECTPVCKTRDDVTNFEPC